MTGGGPARILLFALDDLRHRYAHLVPLGADPCRDTTPFRAFRTALLDALVIRAAGEAELSLWWEGGYNDYALAVAVAPGEAVPGIDEAAGTACPLDDARDGPVASGARPLARLRPGHHDLLADADGARYEAPFGAPTGHFGAPGLRRLT